MNGDTRKNNNNFLDQELTDRIQMNVNKKKQPTGSGRLFSRVRTQLAIKPLLKSS